MSQFVLTEKQRKTINSESEVLQEMLNIIASDRRMRRDPNFALVLSKRILGSLKESRSVSDAIEKTTTIFVNEAHFPMRDADALGSRIVQMVGQVNFKILVPLKEEKESPSRETDEIPQETLEDAKMFSDIIQMIQKELKPDVPVNKIRLLAGKIVDRIRGDESPSI